eukprot:CAMPEP_0206131318 /NCGR_PEP_ID=MMETSP1472-20131121/44602_1 /ASSEMBLY_ACC=CAM_ASM_001108 /TAXON_ID=41880 /ORGANISM="Pycnococcus provasolii, Strain RCC251" /LENGTH=86 /DNA_ID=CAMNT_0053522757 /DNA_START=250 /DNA_END=510 /DNA_ORIENTATION=+
MALSLENGPMRLAAWMAIDVHDSRSRYAASARSTASTYASQSRATMYKSSSVPRLSKMLMNALGSPNAPHRRASTTRASRPGSAPP